MALVRCSVMSSLIVFPQRLINHGSPAKSQIVITLAFANRGIASVKLITGRFPHRRDGSAGIVSMDNARFILTVAPIVPSPIMRAFPHSRCHPLDHVGHGLSPSAASIMARHV